MAICLHRYFLRMSNTHWPSVFKHNPYISFTFYLKKKRRKKNGILTLTSFTLFYFISKINVACLKTLCDLFKDYWHIARRIKYAKLSGNYVSFISPWKHGVRGNHDLNQRFPAGIENERNWSVWTKVRRLLVLYNSHASLIQGRKTRELARGDVVYFCARVESGKRRSLRTTCLVGTISDTLFLSFNRRAKQTFQIKYLLIPTIEPTNYRYCLYLV